jgi:hypothetical protein
MVASGGFGVSTGCFQRFAVSADLLGEVKPRPLTTCRNMCLPPSERVGTNAPELLANETLELSCLRFRAELL